MNESVPSGSDDPFRVIGRVVAKHRVLRLIGAGAMGAVYEGEHVDLGERRALKFCHVHAHSSVKQRAVNEARIGAAVRHPGICLVHDFEWGPPDGTTPVMVMELLRGRTLLDAMIERRRLPWREVFDMMAAICDALAVAHAQGVVHRDIKPDNLFLTDAGPKVCDFGIAMLAQMRVTRTGMMLGTPAYASPEQVTNSKHVDARTDIYSCGVVLYHAISGRRMFPGVDGNGLLVAILNERPQPFREVAPEDVPDHVAAVVDRCVAKEQGQRYPSAQALSAALRVSLAAGNGPLRAGADEQTLTPPPSEAHTASLRPVRDPAAPRQLMATAPGKAAPHAICATATAAEDRLAASTPRPLRPAVVAVDTVVTAGASRLVPIAPHDAPASTRPARRLGAVVGIVTALLLTVAGGAAWLLGRNFRSGETAMVAATPRPRAAVAPRPALVPAASAPAAFLRARGHVRVVTTPAGATVSVAGHVIGPSPAEVEGAPDQLVRVHLELQGYVPRDDDVMPSIEGGEADFSLKPISAVTLPEPRHRRHYPNASTPKDDAQSSTTSKPVLDKNGPVDPF